MQACNPFHLWILCLDDISVQFLSKRRLLNVSLIKLHDVENWDTRLSQAKANRSKIEYYFTLSPFLPAYILKTNPEVDLITYLDADLYFYSDVSPIFEEMGSNSILIIGHKFSSKNLNMQEGWSIQCRISFIQTRCPRNPMFKLMARRVFRFMYEAVRIQVCRSEVLGQMARAVQERDHIAKQRSKCCTVES